MHADVCAEEGGTEMNVRVDPDRADRKYRYGETARMKVFVTNDGKASAVLHSVKLRFLTADWEKTLLGSVRVEPGESRCIGETEVVVGLWTAGRGSLFEAGVLYTIQKDPPTWSEEQEWFDQGNLNVEPALPNNKKIFVSHSNDDKDLVSKVASALELFGFLPYVAELHAKPGDDLWEKILENMEDSHAIVVLLTMSGRSSHDVREEIGSAQMLKRLRPDAGFKIVPVVTDGGGMPGGSLTGREFVRIDTKGVDGGMDDLVSNLRQALGMKSA